MSREKIFLLFTPKTYWSDLQSDSILFLADKPDNRIDKLTYKLAMLVINSTRQKYKT